MFGKSDPSTTRSRSAASCGSSPRSNGINASVNGVPTIVVARTDALAADLLTSDIDPIDEPFLTVAAQPAYDIGRRAINLPSAMKLVESDVDRVCAAFREILVGAKVAS